jgi:uncharacterized protein (TIGR00369 family)
LPGLLGIEILSTDPQRVTCRVPVKGGIVAPHGFVHGGTLVSVADTLCGYGCIINLPPGASGFVTIELKTNFLATVSHGALFCEATPVHLGGNTQVWDAVVTDEDSGKRLAIFRCTQMVLRSKRLSGPGGA